MRLQLARAVLYSLDSQAALMHLDGARFFRLLMRRDMGTSPVERAADAPRPPIVDDVPVTKEPFVVLLPAELHAHLHAICNGLGGGAPSTVASHWILDWVGNSPLAKHVLIAPPAAIDAKTLSERSPQPAGTRRRRTPSRPSKVRLFSLSAEVQALLRDEAAGMGIRHTELLRNLLRAKAGLATFHRSPTAPRRSPLSAENPTKSGYRIHLPLEQVALIDTLALRLGGGEKSTILSHLILDFVGISPLTTRPAS